MAQIYDNIRIALDGTNTWSLWDYVQRVIDTDQDYLVVLHRHGKKEKPHWHVVGVKKADHLKDHGHPEPGKPIQKKKQKYDTGAFAYVLKPKEYAHEDCVLHTNLSEAQIAEYAKQSQEYHDALKQSLPDFVALLKPGDKEEPEAFHDRLQNEVWDFLNNDKDKDNPHGKIRMPIVTYMLRSHISRQGARFRPYLNRLSR